MIIELNKNMSVDVQANIEVIDTLSAHADYNKMIEGLKQAKDLHPKQVLDVHGLMPLTNFVYTCRSSLVGTATTPQ